MLDSVHFALRLDGSSVIDERATEKDHHGGWPATTVFSADVEDMDLAVFVDDWTDDKPVMLWLNCHHVHDKSSERVFHAKNDGTMSWDDVTHLHAFLGFLLSTKASS